MKKKNLASKVVESEKKEAKKNVKRAVLRTVCACLGGVCLLCIGFFLGVHHRVIEAMIKGEEPPKATKGYCRH